MRDEATLSCRKTWCRLAVRIITWLASWHSKVCSICSEDAAAVARRGVEPEVKGSVDDVDGEDDEDEDDKDDEDDDEDEAEDVDEGEDENEDEDDEDEDEDVDVDEDEDEDEDDEDVFEGAHVDRTSAHFDVSVDKSTPDAPAAFVPLPAAATAAAAAPAAAAAVLLRVR